MPQETISAAVQLDGRLVEGHLLLSNIVAAVTTPSKPGFVMFDMYNSLPGTLDEWNLIPLDQEPQFDEGFAIAHIQNASEFCFNLTRTQVASSSSKHVSASKQNSWQRNTSHKCPTCGKAFPLRKTMLRHIRTAHGLDTVSCSICNQTFKRKDILQRHMTEQHTSIDHHTICRSCGRRVAKRAMNEHLDS